MEDCPEFVKPWQRPTLFLLHLPSLFRCMRTQYTQLGAWTSMSQTNAIAPAAMGQQALATTPAVGE